MTNPERIQHNYENARSVYRSYGVDTELVLEKVLRNPAFHALLAGGRYPGVRAGLRAERKRRDRQLSGAARSGDELRRDIETVFSMVPSRKRVSLHTIYGEPESPRERCDYAPEDFRRWIDWAKKLGIGLDYNPTFFAHPMMKGGFSLASPDKAVRDYWVKVGIGSREIAAAFGRELGTPAWNDLWVPDGMKDLPANRLLYREIPQESLDRIYEKPFDAGELVDVVEGSSSASVSRVIPSDRTTFTSPMR